MPEETTLAESMLAIFGEMTNPKFDKENPHFRNKYVSLAALEDHIRPVLFKNGVWYAQEVPWEIVTIRGKEILIYTALTHFSNAKGERITYSWPYKPGKEGPQEAGSAGTYAKRQGICAALGIAGEEDDDGEAAETERPSSPEKPVAAPPLVTSDKNLALDKGETIDDYRAEIATLLKQKTNNDPEKFSDELEKYSAYTNKKTGEKVPGVRNIRDEKFTIGRAKTTRNIVKGAFKEWAAEQVDPDAEVVKFIEEGGMP